MKVAIKIATILAIFSAIFLLTSKVSQAASPTKIISNITEATTWTKDNSPYIVYGKISVKAPLTIKPGTIVKLGSGSLDQLYIQSDFIAKGTKEEPIIFTSYKDDSVGGDTNKDNGYYKPQASDWSSLIFIPAQDKILDIEHAKIMYSAFGISIYSSSNHFKNRTVKNCEIKNNGYGIIIYNAEPIIENNAITNNGVGIRVDAISHATVAINNSIFGNDRGAWGMNNTYPEITALDARQNWWGNKERPDYQENAEQNDDDNVIVGNVTYDPWLKEDPINTPDPVLIIPGIMGSWEKGGKWKIDPILHTYDNLLGELTNNGYILESEAEPKDDQNLFTFPYQWRNGNAVNAIELRGRIQQIREKTGRPKVDIVAHSMGGLLAREYIESDYYQNDVDQLITVGTPQNGAPKSYLMWEAGESGIHFEDKIVMKFFTKEAEKFGYDSLFHYIQKRVTSTKELLPDYAYLFDKDLGSLRAYPSNYPENSFLDALNHGDEHHHLENLKKIEFDVLYGKVLEENTIVGYDVINAPAFGEYWLNGYPENYNNPFDGKNGIIYGAGDGTVPVSSASDIPADYKEEINSSHNDLPTEAQNVIVQLLTGHPAIGKVTSYGASLKDILLIQVYCPIDIQVISPSGKIIGTDFSNNKEVNELETDKATYINNGENDEFVLIPNPEDGEYKISAQGTGTGAYKIEATKITEDENDPQGAKESTGIITGMAEIGKIKEETIEVTPNEVISNQKDTTLPAITGASTTDPNANGWYNGDVTVHFSASDAESGIDTVTSDITISTEGENQSTTGKATDKAGNSASFTVSGINIDKTPPTIKIVSPINKAYLNDEYVLNFSSEINDSQSGIEEPSVRRLLNSQPLEDEKKDLSLKNLGNYNYQVHAKDKAGNLGSAEINFQNATAISAVRNNLNHYWDLGLVKKKIAKRYFSVQLKRLENIFNLLEKTKNSNLKPKPKQAAIEALKKVINADINLLVRQLNRKSPRWIDPQAAGLIIASLDELKNF